MNLETRWDTIYGLRMFSRYSVAAGAGQPSIVLVHGLSMSSLYMLPAARSLALNYHVYAPDLPGYGRSQQPRGRLRRALTVAQAALVLSAWLDRCGVGPAVLVGNSMGCQYIVELARREPERVLGIVLVGLTMDPGARSLFGQLMRGALQLLFEPVGFYPVALLDYLRHGLRRTFQTIESGLGDSIQAKLQKVSAPALVVRGQHDRIVSQGWAEEAARLLPTGRIVTVAGAGHVVNFDSAEQLVELIHRFYKANGWS